MLIIIQLNNPEEQEDVVRRELNKRRDLVKKVIY